MTTVDQEAELWNAADHAASPEEPARRMEHIARVQGVDLGKVRTVSGWDAGAEVITDRGRVVVSPQPEDATFRVRILDSRVSAWSEGWTSDLAAAVGVAGLWRRGGRLRELQDRVPFMSRSELAQAFEDGDPILTKWRQLLSSEWHLRDRLLLQAAHAHRELPAFHPDMSQCSLMLSRKPFDFESGLVKIMPLSGDNYRVTMWPVVVGAVVIRVVGVQVGGPHYRPGPADSSGSYTASAGRSTSVERRVSAFTCRSLAGAAPRGSPPAGPRSRP
ncbi:hypothetical protein ACFT7S_13060 [Streptomyces sp. NPDC057136]|uniref:hypothetical protein n=1 Tax=Streptomyces sp. NPDC057136 TaxID=3346029 RepID=UPI00362ABB7B